MSGASLGLLNAHAIRAHGHREFELALREWITSLARDARMLDDRGNHAFAGDVRAMLDRARRLLDAVP